MNVASMGSGYQGQGIEAVLFNGSEVRHGADRKAEFNLPMFGTAGERTAASGQSRQPSRCLRRL